MITQHGYDEVGIQNFVIEVWIPETDTIEVFDADTKGNFENAKRIYLKTCSDMPNRYVRLVGLVELIMKDPDQ